MKKLLCLLACCGILGCQPKRTYTDTDRFAYLLKTAFNKKIDSAQHFYLLVVDGCHGCSGTSSRFFHSLITKDSSLPITIIISNIHNLPREIRHDRIVWLDTSRTVDRCPLLEGNVCLVEVHNGAVDSVRNFEINDVSDIDQYVNFTKKLPN